VWLALGSNLGDRAGYLEAARAALPGAGMTVVRASPVAETEPVGVRDQPRFLNQVLEVETSLEPRPLLEAVKAMAAKAGVPYQRFIRQALETAVQPRKGP